MSTVNPRPEIIQQVNQLMQSGFELPEEKLVPTALLTQDLGLDSLDAVDMVVHLEEKLNVKIDGERLMSIKTLGDVYALAEEALMKSDLQPEASQ